MELIRFKQSDNHDMPLEFEKIDHRLRFLVMAISGELQYRFNYTPTLTEIFRTQEEQSYIYRVLATEEEKARYALNPVISTHQVWRAVDLRTNDMTPEIIDFIKDYFKYVPYDLNRNIQTLVYHNVGVGIHCHVQVSGEPNLTCIRSVPI